MLRGARLVARPSVGTRLSLEFLLTGLWRKGRPILNMGCSGPRDNDHGECDVLLEAYGSGQLPGNQTRGHMLSMEV